MISALKRRLGSGATLASIVVDTMDRLVRCFILFCQWILTLLVFEVAIKKMLEACEGELAGDSTLQVFDEFRREVSLMSSLKHPNVVELLVTVLQLQPLE